MNRVVCFVVGCTVGMSAGCRPQAPDASILGTSKSLEGTLDIPTRVFSVSPTLGIKPNAQTDPTLPNYGALKIFFDKVEQRTTGTVRLSVASWQTDRPDGAAPNTVVQQVGIDGDGRDAAYDNGGALNPVWGFVYNSVPFGLSFDLMVQFLYERGGLALVQSLLDLRGLNVKALPVVGSNPQGSGYFKRPIGKAFCGGEPDCLAETPIGLTGLCLADWTWRYLPPAQNIVDRACNNVVGESAKLIHFVSSVPGGGSLLTGVLQGGITAFEYATVLDDYDVPPSLGGGGVFPPLPSLNPGHKGLRFYHSPQWHQPFYIGWIMLNKTSIWDQLNPVQKAAFEAAAREALEESYALSGGVQCETIQRMFSHNNGQMQVDNPTVSADMKWAEWPDEALDELQIATGQYIESLKGGASPTIDQQDFVTVMAALDGYKDEIQYQWKRNKFEYPDKCPQPAPR